MKRTAERRLLWVVIATGVVSVAAQLVIIREFLSLFAGNEFIIAVTLFNWLVLGGIGTLLQRFLAGTVPATGKTVSLLSLFLCVAGIAEIYLIRLFYPVFFFYGVQAGFWETFLFNIAVSSPYCLLVGYLLPFTLQAIKRISKSTSSVKVYMADNAGDALGGALYSFVLVWFFSPAKALFLAALPLAAAAVAVMGDSVTSRTVPAAATAVTILAMAAGICFESATLQKKNSDLVFYEETPYGRVEVHSYKGDYTFYRDGVPLFDTKNTRKAEELVHFSLSQLGKVENVLFISASAGLFQEAQKYNPDEIVYVEIDPRVSRAMFEFSFLNRTDAVRTVNQDAGKYLKESREKYSAVIMALPDPDNYQLNRYFTREFFSQVRAHLKTTGVFVFSVKGYDNYVEEALLKKISSLWTTGKSCFDNVLVIPASETYFVLSRQEISPDIAALVSEKAIPTTYISRYYAGDVTDMRMERLAGLIHESAPLNRDFSPVVIQYALSHWFAKFHFSPLFFALISLAVFSFYVMFLTGSETVLFFTGFTAMSVQILIIFVFQILFGYIYLKTGMIITLFLAGLLPGAWTGWKFFRDRAGKAMIAFDVGIVLLVLFFVMAVFLARSALPQTAFFGYSFVFAFFCGVQFSLAVRAGGDTSSRAAGLFAADLIGAAAGLLVFSLVLVPYLGIFQSVLVLCLIKSVSMIRMCK